jgi:hypothetical protein
MGALMSEHHLDRVVWSPLEVKKYTVGDVAAALVFLHNARLLNDDELKLLAQKAERMWPRHAPPAEERIAELEAEILSLEEANGIDRARLAELPEEPWPLEGFDEHSELTKERAGDEADALAEYHESMRWGG